MDDGPVSSFSSSRRSTRPSFEFAYFRSRTLYGGEGSGRRESPHQGRRSERGWKMQIRNMIARYINSQRSHPTQTYLLCLFMYLSVACFCILSLALSLGKLS